VIRRLLLTVVMMAAASTGQARASGMSRETWASTIHTQYVYLLPNTAYTIETRNLSQGGDTVLYVLNDDGRGAAIGANDDCPGGGLRSCVMLTASPNWRLVAILVRSYSSSSIGSGELRVCGSWCDTFWMPKYAGSTQPQGETLQVNNQVMTIRSPQHPSSPAAIDTVVIARPQGHPTFVSGFADEYGLRSTPETTRRMSRTRLATACATCSITYGVPQWAPEGRVIVAWDSGGPDCDSDGWSDSFEGVMGGLACVRDTDGDGLDDGEEFYGVETASESLQFPAWGAEPWRKDVFVEADWVENPAGDLDEFRLTDGAALDMQSRYLDDPTNSAGNPIGTKGFTLHIDSGRPLTSPPLPANPTLYGNWGGANRITQAMAADNCAGMSPSRWGYFRHAVMHNGGGGNGGGQCYNANHNNGWHNSHELGHTLGLSHGGTDASVQANCKPNYRSIMNYVYSTSFSRGSFASTPLNPTALDETNPFGNDPNLIGYLEQAPYYFNLERQNGVLTGNIDWNRDGLFENAARGAPNFLDAGGGCEFGMMHRTVQAGSYSEGFQARLGSDGVYWFAIDSSGRMTWRKAYELGNCDQSNTAAPCPGNWSAPQPVPDTLGGQVFAYGGAAAEWYNDPNNWYAPTIMLVYKRSSDQRLVFQALARDWWTGAEVWSPALPVGPITQPMPLNAEPTLVNPDGALRLYVPTSADQILELRFDWTTRSWIGQGVAVDGNGQALVVGAGPDGRGLGVVMGYQNDAGTARRAVYGVFRGPDNRVQMVRQENDRTWTRMPEVFTSGYAVKGAPRLGYVPFRSTDPTAGRFYLLYRPWGGFNTSLAITQGNVSGPGTVRRLGFIGSATVLNAWGWGNSSYSLMSDVDGLRATFTQGTDLWYLPFVDGVYNANFRDVNDFAVMATKVAL
jgi:hypothetical protein